MMSSELEVRDHRGVLHEARDARGRLVYSSRSNYAREVIARFGRPDRALRRGRRHRLGVSGGEGQLARGLGEQAMLPFASDYTGGGDMRFRGKT